MFHSTSAFIRERLPEIIVGRAKGAFTGLFSTYNNVHGFAPGQVGHGKLGLELYIQSGGASYSTDQLMGILAGVMLGQDDLLADVWGDAVAEHEGSQRSTEVANKSIIDQMKDGAALVVIYAGLSAFESALLYAESLRDELPAATIVVVTCDCNHKQKSRVLASFVDRGIVNEVVMTSECGGRDSMGEIAQAVLDLWPA